MESFNTRKVASLLLILAIAVIFTLQFGPGSRGCEAGIRQQTTASSAAVVNGKEIPLGEFRSAYRNMLNMYRSQGVTEQLARQLGFHKQVLDQLINTELLAQAAEKHGIAPSDEELAQYIHRDPNFQKNGQFDLATYRDVLRQYYRKTDVEFERDLRHQLAAQKMLDTVAASAAVSEDEVKSRFLKEANKAQATFVRFAPTMFADKVPNPKPEELKAYADAHGKQIEEQYNQNKFLYNQPEQVHARHILIKVPENATADQKKAAREKVEALRKEIAGGKDFAEVAKQSSEDTGSKAQGGDLGFNTYEAWVKPFSDAAFALKPGELSQPVETQFGYHLIKVEEKKPPQNKSLDQVRDEIATQLWKKEKAKELAKAEAEKALAAVKGGKDLAALYPPAKEGEGMQFQAPTAPQATETGEFNAAAEAIPRLGMAPNVLPDVFARTAPGALDKVYEVTDSFVVVNVTARSTPQENEFAAQKDKLYGEARKAKEFELRDSFLKALKKDAKIQTNDAAIDELLGPAQS